MIQALITCATLAVLILSDAGPFTPDAMAQSEATLVGAGDVGRCYRKPASETEAAKTAALIEQIPGTVFVAGDLVYEYGEEEGFGNCYDPTWGRFKARTLPVPGNHDYYAYKAAPYYAYWGRAAGGGSVGVSDCPKTK
jgi:3',5'-cyclic AMP phosphodiesterase CpdA